MNRSEYMRAANDAHQFTIFPLVIVRKNVLLCCFLLLFIFCWTS